ncbi:MAG: GtrA family protein [Bacteroidetes bacterium]|nr:MAG: GtrA family protein [Bacteroidota bacterium]
MRTFLKVQAASIIGSAADYLITILLLKIFHFWYLAANFTGNVTGGAVQFILSRGWAFQGGRGGIKIQIIKYILFFVGNILLSACGVFLLTHFAGLDPIISKTITSILLGLTYNYFVQKKFVFGR